jgi:DNA polymerase III epsilon subunit-like protein
MQGWNVVKKYLRVPELMLGFDTETTGLDVASERAISYGFCAYHYGKPVWDEQFFVIPDRPIAPGAHKVHGLSIEDLEAKRSSETVLSVKGGLLRAVDILRRYQERGAFIVGANVVRFDLEMLRRSYESVFAMSLADETLDLSLLQIIDVVEHDLVIEPSRDLRPRRGLSTLCAHYLVNLGGHDALSDARASVEVFMEQVIRNNAGQMPLDLVAGDIVATPATELL